MIWFAIFALLSASSAVPFRIAAWHQKEAAFWAEVQRRVNYDPSLDSGYRPILMWVQQNRPSVLERLRGWRAPDARMLARLDQS